MKNILFIVGFAFTFGICRGNAGDHEKGLSKKDAALIKEAINIVEKTGNKIWPRWKAEGTAFLYKTEETDYLINHPAMPSDFSVYYDDVLGANAGRRKNTDKRNLAASYPVEGIQTVIITAPQNGDNPCEWTLIAVHELFHVFQGTDRIVNPFVGKYTGLHELSFPYNYKNAELCAAHRIEAELLFNLAVKKDFSMVDSLFTNKIFKNMNSIFHGLINDSLQYKYKQWMEWKEGIAKYTECKIREGVASDPDYEPVPEFSAEFPDANYAKLLPKDRLSFFYPIRFIGEGVRGTTMFYYSGMAKAMILDKLYSDWKKEYFNKTLDVLIQETGKVKVK